MPDRVPHLGVLLPTREFTITNVSDAPLLIEFARSAESLGFDSVWAGDSLTARPRFDPLLVLSAVAAVTDRIGLGTAAFTPALRHPLVAANLISSLDHLSSGRLTLGLGSGFPIPETEREFAAVGVPYVGRAGHLDEIVDLWHQMWRGADLDVPDTFTGRYVKASGLNQVLPPARRGGPLLWLAGSDTPAVLRRAASRYDGWLPYLPSASRYQRAWRRIRDLLEESGRPADSMSAGFYATVMVNHDEKNAKAELEDYIQRYYRRSLDDISQIQAICYGSEEKCIDWLSEYLQSGANHIIVRIGSLTPQKHLAETAEGLCAALK